MEINVMEMMRKIREDIQDKGEAYYNVSASDGTKSEEVFYEILPLSAEFEQRLYEINQTWNIKWEDDTHAGLLRRQFKKLVRRVLGPVFFPMYEKQKEFNAECVRAMNLLADEIRKQDAEVRQLQEQMAMLEDKIVRQ